MRNLGNLWRHEKTKLMLNQVQVRPLPVLKIILCNTRLTMDKLLQSYWIDSFQIPDSTSRSVEKLKLHLDFGFQPLVAFSVIIAFITIGSSFLDSIFGFAKNIE